MRTGTFFGGAVLGAAVLIALGEGGEAGSPHEAVVKEMLRTLEQVTGVLGKISDEASAEAARPELRAADKRMLQLRKKAKELKQPSKEEKDRLAREYRARFEDALKKLRAEVIRVKGIPGGDAAVKELSSLNEKPREGG